MLAIQYGLDAVVAALLALGANPCEPRLVRTVFSLAVTVCRSSVSHEIESRALA